MPISLSPRRPRTPTATVSSTAVSRARALTTALRTRAQKQTIVAGDITVAADKEVGTTESVWRQEVRNQIRASYVEGGRTEALKTAGALRVDLRGETRVPDATVAEILRADVERIEKELGNERRAAIPQIIAPITVESQLERPIRRLFVPGVGVKPMPLAPMPCPPGETPMYRADGSMVCVAAAVEPVAEEAVLPEPAVYPEEALLPEEAVYPEEAYPVERTPVTFLPPEKAGVSVRTKTFVGLGLLGLVLLGGGIYLGTRKKKR